MHRLKECPFSRESKYCGRVRGMLDCPDTIKEAQNCLIRAHEKCGGKPKGLRRKAIYCEINVTAEEVRGTLDSLQAYNKYCAEEPSLEKVNFW